MSRKQIHVSGIGCDEFVKKSDIFVTKL